MRRFFHFAALALLVAVAFALPGFAQPRRGSGVRLPRTPPPRAAIKMLDRLSAMSPEQRERMLSKLPPERRRRVERRLEEYNRLPPEERRRLRYRFEQFEQLPPERQEAARKLFSRFRELPEDRRKMVQQALRRFRAMEEGERRARLDSEEFRSRFNPTEQQLLKDMSAQLLDPLPSSRPAAGEKP